MVIKNNFDSQDMTWCITQEFIEFRELPFPSMYENKVSQCLISIKIKNRDGLGAETVLPQQSAKFIHGNEPAPSLGMHF